MDYFFERKQVNDRNLTLSSHFLSKPVDRIEIIFFCYTFVTEWHWFLRVGATRLIRDHLG